MFVWLVEWPVSCRYWPCTIVRVFFSTPFHTKRATFSVCGAHCGACSARILRKFSLNVHALCMRRCWGGFGGVGLPLLQIVFWCTCVLQLPSVWSKEASVLAHQGVQEGSGTCNFFSNGYCSQVLCMWTGVVALGAGLRHDEVAYRHLSFGSCRCVSASFSIHTQCFCAIWRQLLPRFHNPLVFTCSAYYAGIAPCEYASSYVAFGLAFSIQGASRCPK